MINCITTNIISVTEYFFFLERSITRHKTRCIMLKKYLRASMISASKYQHIIYFMSLLKVSLCINSPKQRLLCMDTRRECRSKRSLTPWKNKKHFISPFCYFFYEEGFMLRSSSYEVFFFIVWRPFCYFFFTWGAFLLRRPPGVGLFSQCGGLFCYFFLHLGGLFVFMGDFMSLCFFLMGLLLPPMIYFAGTCYYVTFIPCPPPSLTAAIFTQQSPLQHPCSIYNNNEII